MLLGGCFAARCRCLASSRAASDLSDQRAACCVLSWCVCARAARPAALRSRTKMSYALSNERKTLRELQCSGNFAIMSGRGG
jgi:hypothetical protein